MVLTVDIGNTNIVLGGFVDDNLTFVARIATNANKTEDEYATKIKSILALHKVEKKEVKGAIISSVVPPLTRVMSDALKMVYGIEPLLVGPGIKTGINIRCDDPSSVGADLICGCVAAIILALSFIIKPLDKTAIKGDAFSVRDTAPPDSVWTGTSCL